MTDTDNRIHLTVEGPAAFAGAFVDALQRHDVEVFDFDGGPPVARSLDVDAIVQIGVVAAADDAGIEAATKDFLTEFPEAIVREAEPGLG